MLVFKQLLTFFKASCSIVAMPLTLTTTVIVVMNVTEAASIQQFEFLRIQFYQSLLYFFMLFIKGVTRACSIKLLGYSKVSL
jgi:hypothetical protein